MEKSSDLEVKYQKLATEYSKVRSQATVLKKALLEEQTKSVEMKELMKEQEQKIRKHTHEMESLTFRNEQLAKRISVLQQELQSSPQNKKVGKNKPSDTNIPSSFTVLDEELHKKILENAQLASTMADRDLEITNLKEKVESLENEILQLQNHLQQNESKHKEEIDKLTKQARTIEQTPEKNHIALDKKESRETNTKYSRCCNCEEEALRWKRECEMLRSKPVVNKDLSNYYESQIRSMLDSEQSARSEASSLWAENEALTSRLEQALADKGRLETNLEKCTEELHLISQNYKVQLDAMTEHFATQNDKITKQCDEIQALKQKLTQRK